MRIGIAGPIDVSAFAPWLPPSSQLMPGYTFGFTTDLTRHYLECGHDVVVYAADESLRSTQRFVGERCVVNVAPRRADYRSRGRDCFRAERRSLEWMMSLDNVDVIHAHWTYEFALAALRQKVPTLVTVHDWAPAIFAQRPDPYRLSRIAMQARTLSRATNLAAPSPYISDKVMRWYRKRPTVVPNGVDLSSSQRHQVLRQSSWPVLGGLNSGFDRHKNVRTLLKAFSAVKRIFPTATCRLAGRDYEVGGSAQRWSLERGLDSGVEWVGPLDRSEVPDFLTSLDLFVHPSLEESFGMVLLEAMAQGVPVLGGRASGAVPWVIGPENTADVEHAPELANAITERLQSLSTRDSRKGIVNLSRFDLRSVGDCYLDLLANLP